MPNYTVKSLFEVRLSKSGKEYWEVWIRHILQLKCIPNEKCFWWNNMFVAPTVTFLLDKRRILVPNFQYLSKKAQRLLVVNFSIEVYLAYPTHKFNRFRHIGTVIIRSSSLPLYFTPKCGTYEWCRITLELFDGLNFFIQKYHDDLSFNFFE